MRLSILPPARNQGTVGGCRDIMRDQLFAAMLDARLDELSQGVNPPFINQGADRSLFGAPRIRDEAVLQAIVANDGIARGLDALVTELARDPFRLHGHRAGSRQAGADGRRGACGDREHRSRVREPRRRVRAQLPAAGSAANDLAGGGVSPPLRPGDHAGRDQRAGGRLVPRAEPSRLSSSVMVFAYRPPTPLRAPASAGEAGVLAHAAIAPANVVAGVNPLSR